MVTRTRAARSARTAGASTTADVLEVSLADSQPRIWRRVRVRSDITLDRLHHVIQLAMGWDNDHLHEFETRDGRRFSDPEFEQGFGDPPDTERAVLVRDLLPTRKSLLTYTYDFGDDWVHTIKLVGVEPRDEDAPLAECLAGERACPPEDCGGMGGYEQLLEARGDPDHELRDYMDPEAFDFDPAAFDLKAVNRALKRLR